VVWQRKQFTAPILPLASFRLSLCIQAASRPKRSKHLSQDFSYPPGVGQKGMREVVEFMQQQRGKAKTDINFSKIIDESLIDDLQREGFFKN
jgi:hypothetical protein